MRTLPILVALGLAGWPGVQRPAASPVLELAFDFATRQPLVPVRVNGQPAVPFIVDTGASIHVLDRRVAEQAGAVVSGQRGMRGGGEGSVQVGAVDSLTFEFGGLAWPDHSAVTAGLDFPATKHYAGLIGAPILSQYVVEFAFDRNVLRFFDPSSYRTPPGAVEVPFEVQEGLPIVRVVVDAGTGPLEARLMVDTGASQFVDLNRPFVDRHGLVAAVPDAVPVDRPAALGAPARFLRGTAARVVFAGRSFERVPIGLSRAASGSGARADRDGVIGNDLLRHFVVAFDYRRRVLVVEPLRQEAGHPRFEGRTARRRTPRNGPG